MSEAWIGLGSNLGDRSVHLRRGVEALARLGEACFSSVYETEPIYPGGYGHSEPLFLNQACRMQTRLDLLSLFSRLMRIEEENGRRRGDAGRRRTLDLDLLAFDKLICSLGRPDRISSVRAGPAIVPLHIAVPHPRMHLRAFALVPISEVDKDWKHPLLRRSATELLSGLGQAGVKLHCAYQGLFL